MIIYQMYCQKQIKRYFPCLYEATLANKIAHHFDIYLLGFYGTISS
jgi:hypothetical protein